MKIEGGLTEKIEKQYQYNYIFTVQNEAETELTRYICNHNLLITP